MTPELSLKLERLAKESSDRRYARKAVTNALKYGRLKKEPCVVCGEVKVDGHHTDYNEPLIVVWVCKKHHAMLDKSMRKKNPDSELTDL